MTISSGSWFIGYISVLFSACSALWTNCCWPSSTTERMWISLFLIPWVFILLCSSYPQLNEYFLIQMCDETPVNCVVFTAWMRRVTKQEWRELCRPSSGVWVRKLYGYSTLFILQNVVTVMYLWVCNFWCAQRNRFFLFLFFQVPGTFLLFLWVKTRETNFLGIAEGEGWARLRMETWVMGELFLAELQSSGTGPAASKSVHTALVFVTQLLAHNWNISVTGWTWDVKGF